MSGSGKDRSGRYLTQQPEQFGERLAIEALDGRDDGAAQLGIREWLGQPVELLDRASPGQGMLEPSLVAALGFGEFPAVLGAHGDLAVEVLGIASGKFGVWPDFDLGQERLGICSFDARLFELGRADLVVEERGGDQVFQIVIGLLFGGRMILRSETAAASDVKAALKDLADDRNDVGNRQFVAAL